MMKVFNSYALSSKQRFTRALIIGIASALGLGIAYGLITRILPIRFSIIDVGIGWLIGQAIQKYGRGVQPKFSILAGICALFSFLLAEIIHVVGFNVIFYGPVLIALIGSYFGSINGLIQVLFIAAGVYTAYHQARIL